jgi:hypothetical protein
VDKLVDGRVADRINRCSSTIVTLNLIPFSWKDASYSKMIAFLSMNLDSFNADKFKSADFKQLPWHESGARFDVSFNLLGIILS